ncbi:MAG: M48 family metallopeptidase [Bacteroidetes bacterium]|nr:M48 family metallopeptidase [Bacteroidota bacterium]
MPQVKIQGVDIEYRVLKTRRNRYIRLTVSGKNGVRISAPWGYPERELHAMVREKGAWILDRLQYFRSLEEQQPRWRYTDGELLLVQGEWTPLRITPWEFNAGRLRLETGVLEIRLPQSRLNDPSIVHDLFLRWLRRWALQELSHRINSHADAMRLRPGRITIRAQRSKWGSCSQNGNISLNMRLMLVPPAVADYVMIHELAHLRQLNHSQRFWGIVDRYCPDRKTHQRWLREHSWLLEMD